LAFASFVPRPHTVPPTRPPMNPPATPAPRPNWPDSTPQIGSATMPNTTPRIANLVTGPSNLLPPTELLAHVIRAVRDATADAAGQRADSRAGQCSDAAGERAGRSPTGRAA